MDHIKQRWAKTQVHRLPLGCDQQGRYPEAAHAASEIDDWDPMPTRERWAAWAVLLGVPAAVIVLGIVVALS